MIRAMKRYIQCSEHVNAVSKSDAKKMARELIMKQISTIGYGSGYEDFLAKFEDIHEGESVLKSEMDRVARLFGMKEAYFG